MLEIPYILIYPILMNIFLYYIWYLREGGFMVSSKNQLEVKLKRYYLKINLLNKLV